MNLSLLIFISCCFGLGFGADMITYYSGHLVDMSFKWNVALLDPSNQASVDAARIYTDRIKSTLKSHSTLMVTVARFNSYSLHDTYEGLTKFTMVQFLLMLSGTDYGPSGATLAANMSSAAERMSFRWQRIQINSLSNPGTTEIPPSSDAPGWKATADLLANSMNFTVDPCENFYSFSCDNWVKNNPMPAYLPTYDVFTKLTIEIYEQISNTYSKMSLNNQSIPRAVRESKIFYDSCVKPVNPENDYQFLNDLFNKYGGWPLITKDWVDTIGEGSISAFMGRLYGTLGVNSFLEVDIMGDWSNPKKQIALIAPPEPSLPKNAGDGDVADMAKAIKQLAGTIASKLNIQLDDSQVQKDATSIATVAKKLTDLFYNSDVDENSFPYPHQAFTVATSTERWPYIDWKSFWEKVAQDNLDDPSIVQTMYYVIPWPKYFDNLKDYIATLDQRTLQNYMLWRLYMVQAKYLSTQTDMQFQLDQLTLFIKEKAPLPIHCGAQLQNSFPIPSSRVYIEEWRDMMPSNTKDELSAMVSATLASFKGMLYDLKWIDAQSKIGAYDKIKNVVKNIAYPEWLFDNAKLDASFVELDLSPTDDSFVTNNKLLRFNTWSNIRLLGKPTDRHSFGNPAEVNAFYAPFQNSITFPAGILQPPFFSPAWPMAYNYGNTGATMGHELTHGFDNNGVNWDSSGAYNPWMDKQSFKGFDKMGECVIDEYHDICYSRPSYTEPICIDGRLTEGENIADNGGLIAAWRAYQALVDLEGPEPRLPGALSPYSMDQVFFIAYAFSNCYEMQDAYLKSILLGEAHSPGDARVNGVVKNMPEFAKAFNCPTGSPMAPRDYCHVWVN